jgi:hypothetical protein
MIMSLSSSNTEQNHYHKKCGPKPLSKNNPRIKVPKSTSEILYAVRRPTSQLMIQYLKRSPQGIETNYLRQQLLKVTRKQYFSSLSSLKKYSIITRYSDSYKLTAFGKVIYNLLFEEDGPLSRAINLYWQIYSIDLVDSEEERRMFHNSQYQDVIKTLIPDQHIRKILFEDNEQQLQQQNSAVSIYDHNSTKNVGVA